MGYITDPLTPEDGEAIATGIGFFMAMYIGAALLTAVIILPLLIVSGLNKFLISFVSVNKNLIVGIAIALILIKFLTVHLSTILIVRFLFALMIMVPSLYILLYTFHMADITISVGNRFETTRFFLKNSTVNIIWFESLTNNMIAWISKVFFYFYNIANSIDYSVFSSSLSTINIGAALLCIGKSLLFWGIIMILALLVFVIFAIALVIIIGLPYFIAFGMLILANNFIYKIKSTYIVHLKF